MDPLSILALALGIGQTLFKKGQEQWGTPDWAKYVEAGIAVIRQAIPLVRSAIADPTKYDSLTPQEILLLLTPTEFDELERQVVAKMGQPPLAPPAG